MKPITMQITLTLDEDILTDLIRRAVISDTGIDLHREAGVQPRNTPISAVKSCRRQRAAYRHEAGGEALEGVGRTLWQMENDGRMPAAIRIGGRAVRWSYEELHAWVNAGCPERSEWKWPKR